MAMYPKPPAPKKRVTGMAYLAPKMSKAMKEPKPLSPRDVAKGLGGKTPPSKRVGPSKPKKPSLMNMMETNPKRIGKIAVPKQGGSPYSPDAPAPRRLTGAERDAAIAKEMARGQLLPQRPRKKKKGMGY